METENPEQTQKIEQAVADLSRRYDVRVKDLGNDRFRITLANEACRQEMRNYKAALEHQKILDAVANKTTAAVCMLMVQALLSTSNKPCESYQDRDPLLQTSQVQAKNDRTFEIALDNVEARDIVKSCAANGHDTEETTIRTMICVGLATHVVFGQNSTGTIH